MLNEVLGIPSRKSYGDPMDLRERSFVDYIIHKHDAERAGTHFDIRIGSPELGLFSWATRKELPQPGGRIAVFQQPLHSYAYGKFEGEIPAGYGKGKVRVHDSGQLLITKVSPESIHFSIATKKHPERFVLVKPKLKDDKRWLLVNVTPTKPLPYEKIHYKSVSPERAEDIIQKLQPGSSVQAKIDGAASLTHLTKDKLELLSYRISKPTGWPILHTERVFGTIPRISVPKEMEGTLLRGELYGVDSGGEVIPAHELGGILNSTISNSRQKQKDQNITLRNLVFDLDSDGKRKMIDVEYTDRLARLKEILKGLPVEDTMHLPEEAKTPEDALKLFKSVQEGKHPLTAEGIVIHPPKGTPSKVKLVDEHDTWITGIFQGEGKYKGNAAGGFTYALEPGGPTVGKVGTGLSDSMRKDLWENRTDYIGRRARIKAQAQHTSGAFRAPVLISVHSDYPTAKEAGHVHDRIKERLPRADISAAEKIQSYLDKHPELPKIKALVPIFESSGAIHGYGLVEPVGKNKQRNILKTVIHKNMMFPSQYLMPRIHVTDLKPVRQHSTTQP